MKRATIWLLAIAAALTMLTGCSTAATTEQPQPTSQDSTTTQTVPNQPVAGTIAFYAEATLEETKPASATYVALSDQQAQAIKAILDDIELWQNDYIVDRTAFLFDGEWKLTNDEYTYYFSYAARVIYYDHYYAEIPEEAMQQIKGYAPTDDNHLASHVQITAGDTTISPYSRLTWWRIDNGDGTCDEMIADHCDPVSLITDPTVAIPTLTVKDSVSYAVQANGMVEAVYLYSPVGDTYAAKSTAWEALDTLPNGTYYVMLAVLLGGNCDPDAPQNSYRYEDFFRLVVDKPNDPNDSITPTVQLHPLYQKYPEYFGIDGMKGVEVYVWQMGGNAYYCGALPGTNRMKTEDEIQALFANGATLEEMRTILELCEVGRDRVSIIPVRNPLSSFWYEIDVAYRAELDALFWGD